MIRIIPVLFILCLSVFVGLNADAQSLMQTARKAEQHAKEMKQKEIACYNDIVDSMNSYAYEEFLANYPKGERSREIRNRLEEMKLWEESLYENTIDAYLTYLEKSKYQWYASDARNAIMSIKKEIEENNWNEVEATGTLEAYRQYLKSNPLSAYKADAEKAINRLEGNQLWESICKSNDVSELQNFVTKYPNATNIALAKRRLHELKAKMYYDKGDLSSAYTEFSETKRNEISSSNLAAYDEALEYHAYKSLTNNATEYQLLNFLKTYPKSKYCDDVSNRVAISKAKGLSKFSSEASYKEALAYAKDNGTIQIVNKYISASKKSYRDYKFQLRKETWKENGGIVNMGIYYMDLGFNLNNTNDAYMAGYYNLSIACRIGNYMTPLQFEIGVRPGVGIGKYNYTDNYTDWLDDEDESEPFFRMPIYAKLNLNLYKRLYVSGAFFYNMITKKVFEKPYTYQIGIGCHWKHWDWLILYYSKEFCEFSKFKSEYYYRESCQYIGMGLIYYFQF